MTVRTRLELPLLMTLGMAFAAFFVFVAAAVLLFGLFGMASLTIGDHEATTVAERLRVVAMLGGTGGLMGAIAYGFRTERVWARRLVPLFWLLSAVYGGVSLAVGAEAAARDGMLELVVQSLLCLLFSLWYFYAKRSVVEYYRALERRRAPTAAAATVGA